MANLEEFCTSPSSHAEAPHSSSARTEIESQPDASAKTAKNLIAQSLSESLPQSESCFPACPLRALLHRPPSQRLFTGYLNLIRAEL